MLNEQLRIPLIVHVQVCVLFVAISGSNFKSLIMFGFVFDMFDLLIKNASKMYQ